MLTLLNAVILGIVEGFTEFLPISSTAHLILASELLRVAQSEYVKTFEIAIQAGAILGVVALYWKKFLDAELLKRIVLAFIPTGIIGLILYKIVKQYLIGNIAVVLWSLAIGGIFLIFFEKSFAQKREFRERELKDITYRQCLILGLCQSVAMIPGVSRAAATIIGGMFLGIDRKTIIEFSFLLAVPTMLAATGLDLAKNAGAFNGSEINILAAGLIASFLTAIVSIRWLLGYIKSHTFTNFGIYRIALVLLFLILLSH